MYAGVRKWQKKALDQKRNFGFKEELCKKTCKKRKNGVESE